jgi:ribokinase
MKYDFITIGGSTEDITLYTRDGKVIDNKDDVLCQKLFAFEYGAKLKVDRSFSSFGGGASNAAVCLSKIGFKVASLVSIGDDNRGREVLTNFKKNKVKTNLIQINKETETGFSFLIVGPGSEHVVFSNRAANNELHIGVGAVSAIKKSKWVYITSLGGKWNTVLDGVFSAEGVKKAWNPGHIQLKAGFNAIGQYLEKTDMLTVNKDEAIELVVSKKEYRDKDAMFLNNSKNLLKVIQSWGPRIVVVTDGKNGANAYDGENYYHQDIIEEQKRVDTTGVGDAFGSTFTAGLEMYHGDIQKAMLAGVKNTASVIGKQGAQNGLLAQDDFTIH